MPNPSLKPSPNSRALGRRGRAVHHQLVGRISDSVMRRMLEGQHMPQYGCAY